MPVSNLLATQTPTPFAVPISDGSGSLDAWVSNGSGGIVAADDVTYSNGSSGLSATNVQDAIDELALSIGSGSSGGGTKTLRQWTPLDNQPPAATFATLNVRNSFALLEFDDSSPEYAVFVGVIPEGANLTSGIRVRIVWVAATATSGDIEIRSAFERCNTDIDTDSFASPVTVITAAPGTSGVPAISVIDHSSSEIDGIAVGDLFRIQILRNGGSGSDTMTGDAQVLAVEIQQRA